MKSFGLGREAASRVVKHDGRADGKRRARAFDPGDQQAMSGRFRARMNREDRDSAKPAAEGGKDCRKRVRPMDHHEAPARRKKRQRALDPSGKGGSALAARFGQDMRLG